MYDLTITEPGYRRYAYHHPAADRMAVDRNLSGGFYNLMNEDYFWSSSESSSSNAWRRYLCYNYENMYRYGNYKTHGARGAA